MRSVSFSFLLVAGMMLAGASARADTAGGVPSTMTRLDNGDLVYHHICAACHMADGKGARGAGAKYPALAGDQKLAIAAYPTMMVLNGHGGMPWFAGILTDRQIADVVTYIRGHLGNHWTDVVTPEQVRQMRQPITLEE